MALLDFIKNWRAERQAAGPENAPDKKPETAKQPQTDQVKPNAMDQIPRTTKHRSRPLRSDWRRQRSIWHLTPLTIRPAEAGAQQARNRCGKT
jgi:hypothetical protein